jgi:hypothetical protein
MAKSVGILCLAIATLFARYCSAQTTTMKELLLATAACCIVLNVANACGGTTTTNRVCYLRAYDRAHLAKHSDQTVSAMRIALSPLEPPHDFDLSVQFRGDNDKWQWATTGVCYRFGPGMTCVEILDGCDTLESNHFYITQNPNTLHLYPREINLHRGNLANVSNDKKQRIPSDERILNDGKDDKIFRLEKTVCWKEEK